MLVTERPLAVFCRRRSSNRENSSTLSSESASSARPSPTLKSASAESDVDDRYVLSFSHFPVTQEASTANGSARVLLASDR